MKVRKNRIRLANHMLLGIIEPGNRKIMQGMNMLQINSLFLSQYFSDSEIRKPMAAGQGFEQTKKIHSIDRTVQFRTKM